MSTTPTPVERAARTLRDRLDAYIEALTLGGLDTMEPDEAVATSMLSAALSDVDEIARVLAPDDWRMADDPRYAHLPDGAHESLLRKSREQAAAVVAHLTGATR